MIGAIVGDIAGSIYEFHNIKTLDFTLFADYHGRRSGDTVNTSMNRCFGELILIKWLHGS